jgi:hypothetical protein
VSPPPERAPPEARQTTDKVSGDYSHQYETISESNSWDFEVPIPPANLDVAGEGFTVTCSDEEALKLIDDSVVMAGHVVDMLGVDMSQG